METLKELLIVVVFAIILIGAIFLGGNYLMTQDVSQKGSEAIDSVTNPDGIVVELDQKNNEKLNKYIEKYGDTALGYAAYILNRIQVYSIPICTILFVVGAFLYWVVSAEKYIEGTRGYGYIVSSIIFLAISQIVPLIFALIVTIGRG